jgi:hypothetical protein
VSQSRKKNIPRHKYQLCHATIIHTSSIKDLGIFFNSKSNFHNYVDLILSQCIKILGLIRSITLRFSSTDCLYMLYFMLVRSKLEYVSVVCNSITSAGPPLWSSGQSFWLQIQRSRVRFPPLPDFLTSRGSGTGSTQPRDHN